MGALTDGAMPAPFEFGRSILLQPQSRSLPPELLMALSEIRKLAE
ncbi:hypothetical protein KR51_00001470 [Rubidibacter lacunae KORDI 51-2]|uniref:Uncharacterized protein n=1 Tax=Rubidibacter lacunae KORDI 51-2 TaxID=582515 RepID=U5DTU9_9CHRO|nr:hypothetical protein KR51_00001470 [Rubidibacter lacunae KORDI 51-2]